MGFTKMISFLSRALFSSNLILESDIDSITENSSNTNREVSESSSEINENKNELAEDETIVTISKDVIVKPINIDLDDFIDDDYAIPSFDIQTRPKSTSINKLSDVLYLHPVKLGIHSSYMKHSVEVESDGYLEMIMGPMFSGKTTALIQRYHTLNPQETVVINYSGDTRYSDSALVSHDQIEIPCVFSKTLGELWYNIHEAKTILINEAQFFPDIYEMVLDMVDIYGKSVYLYGLDGDFQRRPFILESVLPKYLHKGWLDLIPFADKVRKQNAKCNLCAKPAIFSHRLSTETCQVVIGSSNYTPLCRKCYLLQTKK